MKPMEKKVLMMIVVTAFIGLAGMRHSYGDETVKQKMEEVGNDTRRGTQKAYRKVKDETCEMINGKMECTAKKVKHSIQNAADNIEDKAD